MAGRVVVSTLNNDTGVLATQNGMTGIAKSWILYNGIAGTITSSFNVSSVTKNGTGDYTITFTTAMPDANYTYAGSASRTGTSGGNSPNPVVSGNDVVTARTSSAYRIIVQRNAGDGAYDSVVDCTYTSVAVFSS